MEIFTKRVEVLGKLKSKKGCRLEELSYWFLTKLHLSFMIHIAYV
jgi:hypothetical protein